MSNLNFLFKPKSIAVIGASRNPEKLGYMVLNNILKYGYKGEVFPINPEAAKILGKKCYHSVLSIDGKVDLAVLAVPAPVVPIVLEECGKKGIMGAIIISAGFKEAGSGGQRLEEEIKGIGKKYGMRILGPNCLGIIDTYSNLNASFAESMPKKWDIALFSQSGAMGTAILDWANASGIGFTKFVSLGNKSDISETDLLESWIDDEKTEVVLGYLEGIEDGERFLKIAKKLTKKKPFVVIKAGSSDEGARAVSSHTGSLAGLDEATGAAFRDAGIIRVKNIQDFFDASKIFSLAPLPKNNKIAVISNAGGPAVMLTDFIDESSILEMADLSSKTKETLSRVLPSASANRNPVDVMGDAKTDRYESALTEVLKDENVGMVIIILTPQIMTEVEKTAKIISKFKKESKKPIVACFMGGVRVEPGIEILEKYEVPTYQYPERAAKSLEYLVTYAEHIKKIEKKIPKIKTNQRTVREILDLSKGFLTESEYFGILGAYGIPVEEVLLVTSRESAKRTADRLGYPVVLKIASPDIFHKVDLGAVKLDIKDKKEVEKAYNEILRSVKAKAPEARIKGIIVAKSRVSRGQDVIIGGKRDSVFGPLVMFGIGGIYVEVLKDVVFQVCPVSKEKALKMIASIKSIGILTGYRGQNSFDLDAIADVIVRVSNLMVDFPEITELDINPLRVFEPGKGAVVLDAKIII